MGLCPSSDHFCQRTDDAVRSVRGLLKIVDDILGGASDVPALRRKLVELLEVCRKHNLKISRRKFDLATKLSFAGFTIDATGGGSHSIPGSCQAGGNTVDGHPEE